MPELPEVEVLRRSLRPHLDGRRIRDILVSCADLREPVSAKDLERRTVGRRIEDVRRRAKYLLVDLEADSTVIVHLGMSGRLTVSPEDQPPERHEHVSFGLSGGVRLRFRDPRRFGLVLARATSRLSEDRHFAHLGAEPLSADFSGLHLQLSAAARRGPVKSFLMDGRVVVGIGNIYACEALHRAGIHPKRSVAKISAARWQTLADAVVSVLEEAIDQGGTTLNDFADGAGQPGYFQIALAVYDREDGACKRCGRPVRRIIQSGRSTFYCGGCQK